MTFNNGANTEIKLSEVKNFYGGTAPDQLSEYYRGGDEVPASVTVTQTDKAAASASNTNSNQQNSQDTTTGSIRLQRTYDPVTTQTGTNTNSGGVVNYGEGTKYWVNNQGTTANVFAGVSQTADTSDPNFNVRTGASLNMNDDGQVTGCGGGTLLASGNSSGGQVYSGTLAAGANLCLTSSGGTSISWNTLQQVQTPQWDFTLTNNSDETVNLTATLGGSSQNDTSFTAGETKTANNRTSSAWSWSHPAVTSQVTENKNTNIPQSGEISLSAFTNVTSPSA